MRVIDVLSKFNHDYQRSGKWYLLNCPCHADEKKSLGLCDHTYQDKFGNIRDGISVKCFAGCSSAEIKKYLRDGQTNYFNSTPKNTNFKQEKRKLVETYTYTKDGQYVYEVVRWHPKQFSQRRKDRNGKYIWGLTEGYYYESPYGWHIVKDDIQEHKTVKFFRKVEPMLYNLDYIKEKLKQNPEAKIFIVGGEKDVNNLKAINFLATTNSGGEGQLWLDSHTEELKGLNIAFIPDNDVAGYAHLYKVAEALIPHVKSFKVIELPSLVEEHSDVSDWLHRYDGDAEYLRQLYLMADDYKNKPADIKKDFKYLPASLVPDKTDTEKFVETLTEEMYKISQVKDVSKLGLCYDCQGSGYASLGNGYQVRKVQDHLEPIPCGCTVKVEGGLDFSGTNNSSNTQNNQLSDDDGWDN